VVQQSIYGDATWAASVTETRERARWFQLSMDFNETSYLDLLPM